MIPFTVRFIRRLKHKSKSTKETSVFLNYIAIFIKNESGERIYIDKNQLTFRSGFLKIRLNTDIMSSIEKGKFTLIEKENHTILEYEIFMYRFFVKALFVSLAIGMVSEKTWIGCLAFGVIGCLNWSISCIRHRFMLRDILLWVEDIMLDTSNENMTYQLDK